MAMSDVLCTKLWQPFEQTFGDISLYIWFEALSHWVFLLIPLLAGDDDSPYMLDHGDNGTSNDGW